MKFYASPSSGRRMRVRVKYNLLTTFNTTNKTSFSGKDDIVLLWYGHVLLHDDISNEVKINSFAASLYSKLVVFSNEKYKVHKHAAQWSLIFLCLRIFRLTICNAEEQKTNLMSLAILFHFLCAQHVSDINISIIRSLRLFCWITTLVVLFLVRCVLEFRCGWVGVVSVLQAE